MIISLILLVLHVALSIWCGNYLAKNHLPWILGFLLSFLFPLGGTLIVLLIPYFANPRS